MTPIQIRSARKRRGLTQAALASLAGVSERTVRAWEAGESDPPAHLDALLIAADDHHRARYRAILAAELARIDLSESEWVTLCRLLNGTLVAEPPELANQILPLTVADADPGEIEPGCDREALVARLRTLSLAGALAVVDLAERYWSGPHTDSQPLAETLAALGAVVRPEA